MAYAFTALILLAFIPELVEMVRGWMGGLLTIYGPSLPEGKKAQLTGVRFPGWPPIN